MRGGMGYSAQGTGITSGMDTPRPRYYGGGAIGGGVIQGNPMGNRTGFNQPWYTTKDPYEELETIQTQKEEIFAPKKGEWLSDVIGSFGAYANPRNPDGSYKTTGEMGYEQAQGIKKIRDERQEKRNLAKLSNLESREAMLKGDIEHIKQRDLKKLEGEYKIKVEEARGANLEFNQQIKWERERADKAIAALDKTDPDYAKKVSAIEAEFENASKNIVRGNPGMQRLINDAKRSLMDIHAKSIQSTGSSFIQEIVDQWNAKNPSNQKTVLDIIQELAVADVTGTQAASSIIIQSKMATGGRVGYYAGTPNTGAMPMEPVQASVTETIDTPGADMSMTETVTGGQQPTVEMPYQEFRAALPAEVSDEIVQLIYYNQDAFADFAQISTQADVYAFNNKYGVSLVLPMDTETT